MDEILWEGEPLFPDDKFVVKNIDSPFDAVFEHIDKTGHVKIDALTTHRVYHAFNAWEDNVPVDQPSNSRMRMIAGVDPGLPQPLGSKLHVSWLYYFVPDGYWPPIETIEEWASAGFSRRVHRIEHDGLLKDMPAKYQRLLLVLGLVLIFWVVYGADKVLG